MSQLGYSRPVDGVVRRRMEQVLPDVAPLVGVAQPGLALTPPVVQNSTLSQIGDVLNAGLAATARGIEFQAAMQDRAERQRRQAEVEQMRTEAGMAQVEQQFARTREGEADMAAAQDIEVLVGQLERGEISPPQDLSPDSQQEWARSIADARSGGQGQIYEDRYRERVTPRLLGALQNRVEQTQSQDRQEFAESLVNRMAGAASESDIVTSLDEAARLGIPAGQQRAMLIASAEAAASRGRKQLAPFARFIEDDSFTAHRWRLEATADAADERQWAREGAELDRIQRQVDREDADAARARASILEGFRDSFSLDISKAKTASDYESVRGRIGSAMEKNPDFADELLGDFQSASRMAEQFAEREAVAVATQKNQQDVQRINMSNVSAMRSGNGYLVGLQPITVETPSYGGDTIRTTLSGEQQRAIAIEGAYGTELGEQLAALGVTDMAQVTPTVRRQAELNALPPLAAGAFAGATNKYQPIAAELQAGANVDAAAFTDGQLSGVPERSIRAIETYDALKRGSPEVARKYAGDNTDFYESIKYLMQQPGIGNDPAKAIQEHLRIRKANIKVPELPARDLQSEITSGIKDINNENYHIIAPSVSKRRNYFIRSGMMPNDALTKAVQVEKSRVAVINGVPLLAGARILPPGPYNDFKKSAEAAIDYLRQRNPEVRSGTDPVNWEKVSLQMDQESGKTVLVSELGLPVDLPPGDQINTLDDITALAIRRKRQGIMEATKPSKLTPMQEAYYAGKGIDRQAVKNAPSVLGMVGRGAVSASEGLEAAGRWWENMARNTRGQSSNLNYVTGQPNPPYDPRWSIPNSASNPPPPLDDNFFDQNVATPPNRGTR